jgi:hypothetical protein
MMKSSPALLSVDEPQNWKALRTGNTKYWLLPILFLLMGGMGLFLMALGQAARYHWLFLTLSGCGVLSLLFGLWMVLATLQHGEFNLDINQKAKRIRKWKSSVFLRRSFDEYAYDDFCAVRSNQERDDYVVWVVVELLFRTGEPALEVGRFSPVSGGSSYWQKIEKTLRDLSIESPGAAALRQELAKAMGITNAGYSDNEQ